MRLFSGIGKNNDHVLAHEHCKRNRAELERSALCGCFYCLRIFLPSAIHEWIDENQTAMCPHCEIDSVIASESGYSITPEFLDRMRAYWFDSAL
jgi:hypothetical protein